MGEKPVKHFSMIRGFHLADFLTLANGCCGVLAVFGALRYVADPAQTSIVLVSLLVPLAGIFDYLDGRVARVRHQHSPLGRELDSLADLISFGVAPAAIAYAVGLTNLGDQVILIYFVLCGLSRLARFGITADELAAGHGGKVPYFEGAPIPTSIVPLFLLLLLRWWGLLMPVRFLGVRFHLAALLFVVSGSLMISKTLRVPKL